MILLECLIVMSVVSICWEYAKRGVTVSTYILSVIPFGTVGFFCGWWTVLIAIVCTLFCDWGYKSMRIGAVRYSDVFLVQAFADIMKGRIDMLHGDEVETFKVVPMTKLEEICLV